MDKTGKRADGVTVVDIKNPKNSRGQYLLFEGETRLRKEIDRYTTTCPECENDEAIGRYDDRGEVVCVECGLVLSDKGDKDFSYSPPIYADKYTGTGGANQSSSRNQGASGHPLMRTQALRSPGPSGNDSAAGKS